jgi:hypothetical protein
MEMVPKSKKRKVNQKREFIANNQETDAAIVAETIGVVSESSPLREVTLEERHQLIAEAAYFRAQQRNFSPGYELEDWLDAEAEIESRLKSSLDRRPSDA